MKASSLGCYCWELMLCCLNFGVAGVSLLRQLFGCSLYQFSLAERIRSRLSSTATYTVWRSYMCSTSTRTCTKGVSAETDQVLTVLTIAEVEE